MYTVCPKCALTLVVTAADLRVAQGFVRCGRCSNVFNALARLSEDRGSGATGVASPTLSQPAPPPPPPPEPERPAAPEPPPPQSLIDPDSIPDTALEFNAEATDVTKVFVEQVPNPQWSAATGKFKALLRKAQPGAPPAAKTPQAASPAPPPATIPTDQDSQFDIEVDAEFLAATAHFRPQAPPQAAAPTQRPATPAGGSPSTAAESAPSAPAPSAPAPSATTPSATTPSATMPSATTAPRSESRKPSARLPASVRAALQTVGADEDRAAFSASEEAIPAATAAIPLTRLWSFGTAALVVLLAVQIVHHYRNDLAASDRFYGPLTALYSALGVALVPRWNLEAYDVRQLGASADSANAGQITVRASVKNTAKQAQPLPLLRVTLQDRYGNRIAARDVPPKAYLPSAIPASSFLSAGQRIDAEMAFVDPGTNAVGFEIDACLPAPGGSIACQNDAGTR
jgi:predicted Zn finger-like uncharacterized protein